MEMVFQNPISIVNPRKTVAEMLLELFRIHSIPVNNPQKVDDLLEMVGFSSEQFDKYSHQLLGGQASRDVITRELALSSAILVEDEPTAGLDVSVAGSILNFMKDLCEKLNIARILLTHNHIIISFIADRVTVIYRSLKLLQHSPYLPAQGTLLPRS